ncbi:MAG: hypothetical protein DI556_21350 [Rhodovulum sulfidophilum]|uniref:Reductase C-terminal domain-containing protein n=1 Tax=Rhodovulum sulfidophilum TaxID=35806 RepID=A0A2W5PMY2_RHOSU|nr:MAG: hypothetical protein DI556_21350 [Rhodovulum sulfidophilum]
MELRDLIAGRSRRRSGLRRHSSPKHLARGNATPYALGSWFWSDRGKLQLQIAGTGADALKGVLRPVGTPDDATPLRQAARRGGDGEHAQPADGAAPAHRRPAQPGRRGVPRREGGAQGPRSWPEKDPHRRSFSKGT